jgi:hypothetical protein
MVIVGVIDVEIFLAVVRKDRIQLEEVLPPWSRAEDD